MVRDKIPEIIRKNGDTPKTKKLDEDEYKIELYKKLLEEAEEMIEAHENKNELIKEIGDVYEVIEAIIKSEGLSKEDIKNIQNKRRDERGAFEERIFLESTE